jgi:hypothetical protein
MSSMDKVRAAIADIARRRKNVTSDEIGWVINQLKAFRYNVRERKAKHGYLYGVESQRFMVNFHTGNKQVKSYSVDDFISAMIELGLYED